MAETIILGKENTEGWPGKVKKDHIKTGGVTPIDGHMELVAMIEPN